MHPLQPWPAEEGQFRGGGLGWGVDMGGALPGSLTRLRLGAADLNVYGIGRRCAQVPEAQVEAVLRSGPQRNRFVTAVNFRKAAWLVRPLAREARRREMRAGGAQGLGLAAPAD